MSARFIFGRAGSGKTRWCFDRIVESLRATPLGPPIYWLLPRQATFQAERMLACAAGCNGYFRVRAVSFEDLGRDILAECGGSGAAVSDLGRRMILGHLLRRHAPGLRFFASVAHQPGLAAELDQTFAEFERSGQDAATLHAAASTSLGPSLAAKLADLALLYREYGKFLGQERLDPNRRLTEALTSIRRCTSLAQADVYVDGFYDFTGPQRQILAALGNFCKSLAITLCIDPKSPCVQNPDHNPDEMSLFHRAEQAYRRLFALLRDQKVAIESPLRLEEPRRFATADLAALERWESAAPIAAQSIAMIEAPDRRAEVDAAARWIRAAVAEGLRYRDIVVLMRSEQDYRDLIDASFGEHGIPFFMDRRRTAAHHPLLRLIRGAVAVAAGDWPHEAMMATIKTGLVGLDPPETDALENYVLKHGLVGRMWVARPWHDPAIDGLRRRVVDRLSQFTRAVRADKTLPLRTFAAALMTLLEQFDVPGQIFAWMNQAEQRGRLEERGEHERVWQELAKLLDEMVDLLGEQAMSLSDFSAILDSALEGFDLALTPPTVDQVLVGPVDRTRTPPAMAAIVLGLSDGQFPCPAHQGTVLCDADRRALSRADIDLDPETRRRLLDEKFWGYVAFTRASHRLLLTRSVLDEDEHAVGPSVLWNSVRERTGIEPRTAPSAQKLPLDCIATPRQLVSSLMHWVRDGGASDDPRRELYEWLARRPLAGDAVDAARFAGWKALLYRNEARLDPQRAAAMFTSPLRIGIKQLESFRSCPFQHFAGYGLRLAEREQRLVSGIDLSAVYHGVMAKLVGELVQSERTWIDLDDEQTRQRLAELTAQLGGQLRDELMLSSARNRYLLDRIQRTLQLVASAARAAGRRGHGRPGWTDVRFGDDGGATLPPLQLRTPGGAQVRISGKIDRIDLLPGGAAAAIDYRLWGGGLDAPAAFHGLSLQLLTFMLVLQHNGQHLAGGKLTAAAAFCVQLARKMRRRNLDKSVAPDDPLFHLEHKPRGIFDLRFLNQLDKDLGQGSSDVVQVFIKKDGTVGRAQTSDAAGADELAALLRHVEKRIGELADRMIGGEIGIRPYRIGRTTPCPNCKYRDLCRFEPRPGSYDDLESMTKDVMLRKVMEGGG
jgi:ATP-dependent helicase/nuclease subunit B